MLKIKLIKPFVSIIFLALAGQAHAGGLYLYEMGTEDIGLANAGSAARAQDASVVATNPAGMTRLKADQFTVGAMALYGNFKYTMDDTSLNGPGNIVGWQPGGSAFYSHSVSDDLKFGIAFYGTFGLSESFNDNWAGHNLIKEVTLMGLTLQPSLAYRVNNQWSVGAGLGINYGIFSLTRDKLAVLGGYEVKQDDTDIAPNVKLGVLFEPAERTRFGLTYTSKVDYSFGVDPDGTLPITGRSWSLPVNTMLDAPQQVMFSGVQVLNNKWSLLGEIGWQDWSTLGQTEVTVGGITKSPKLDFQDTWHGAVGLQYQLTTDTRLNFGFAYDTSMYENQDNTSLVLPSGAAWRFGTGVQRQLNERSSLGAAFEYLVAEDAKVPAPEFLSGSYDSPQMYFLSLNYSYRF